MEDLHDPSNINLESFIPIVGKHIESWKNVKDHNDAFITRLSGLSNVTCLIKAHDENIEPRFLIFRLFANELCDTSIENMVFETLSEHGIGPKCYFQNSTYRLEENFDSRPITIYEMRNPLYMKKIIDITFKINFNQDLKEKLNASKDGRFPTQIEILRDEWLPKLISKYDHYHDLLTVTEYKESLNLVKERFMREDMVEHINSLNFQQQDNLDELVVNHNDIQENNILTMRRNTTELAVIDYEYTTLGHMEYDLANSFNECCIDNAFPYFPFIM